MDYVPIIDISEIGEISEDVGYSKNWKYVANQIREGLGNIGFVYLKNHGIDRSLVILY